ncbi:MAG: hypothetical protein NTY12_03305 [Candidatus Falkowbacteria bacterium]|nr:hypothetical protein [Candidatus Falkowbacteria bacterium]
MWILDKTICNLKIHERIKMNLIKVLAVFVLTVILTASVFSTEINVKSMTEGDAGYRVIGNGISINKISSPIIQGSFSGYTFDACLRETEKTTSYIALLYKDVPVIKVTKAVLEIKFGVKTYYAYILQGQVDITQDGKEFILETKDLKLVWY